MGDPLVEGEIGEQRLSRSGGKVEGLFSESQFELPEEKDLERHALLTFSRISGRTLCVKDGTI